MGKRPGKKTAAGRKKVVFAYLQGKTFHPIVRSADLESPASLPLGPACVLAYAAADPLISSCAELCGVTLGEEAAPASAARRLAALAPDVAALSCFTLNEAATLRAAALLKKLRPGVKIVLGGASVPRDPARLKAFMRTNPALDAAVFGEGEEPFRGWLKSFLRGEEPRPAAGLALRRGRGVLCAAAPSVPDFSALPSPYLSGAVSLLRKRQGILTLETSRGCPYSCAYCATDAAQRALRYFHAEKLKAELAWLKKKGYAGTVWLVDPLLNLDKARAAGIFRLLSGYKFPFMVNIKPELLDAELCRLLGRVPGAKVIIGVQTVNPATLRNIGRGGDPARSAENIRRLLSYPNLVIALQIILGLPGDDYEQFKRTLDWALAFGPAPKINVYDLLVLDNSRLSGLAGKFRVKTRPDGMVLSNSSFSEADFMRASWCVAVYHAVSRTPRTLALFFRASAAAGRPSLVLEKLAARAVARGLLPRRRLVIDSLGACGELDNDFLETELRAAAGGR